MTVLVDSSIWVDYFRGKETAGSLEWLIEEGVIATNDLILSELLPALIMRKQSKLVSILQEIPRLPLAIDWDEIVANQVACLCNGINNLGIPDLIIAQNAIQNDASLYTLDKHFRLMAKHLPLRISE
jgi:predicted nucleic acid-binding protein